MIGQVIYNLEDYAGSGGLISTNKDNLQLIVTSTNNEDINGTDVDYDTYKVDIFTKNILSNYGIDSVYKLGIQAPSGTKFHLNSTAIEQTDGTILYSDGQEIIIGRTGIYELDDGVKVTSLIFERPKQYTVDVDKTNEYIQTGITQMEEAKYQFDKKYKALKLQKEAVTSSMSNEDFWEEYDIIHDEYLAEYNAARTKYIQGLAGVYVQNDFIQDLKNIIIDFMYNTIEEDM